MWVKLTEISALKGNPQNVQPKIKWTDKRIQFNAHWGVVRA